MDPYRETPTDIGPNADPLAEVLHQLRMTGALYARSELSAPWGVDMPPLQGHLMFHIVTSGHCWLEIDGSDPVLLSAGSLTLVPHGLGHTLVSERGEPSQNLFDLPIHRVSERYETLHWGGGGEVCRLICVVVRFDEALGERLVDALPPVLRYDSLSSEDDQWLHQMLRFIAREAEALRPGGETVITRLADILVMQVIRCWIDSDASAERGWLAALRDDRLGRALGAMHDRPAEDWTLDSLAKQASMSRSAFAAKFTEVVGEPALKYLTRWRLQLARTMLRDGDDTLGVVAERVGYGNEAAFCRAFKREYGESPGSARNREPVSAF